MIRSLKHALAAAVALGFAAASPAQDAPPAAAAVQPAVAAEISLEQAYKKEYAFLEAQKRELGARLAQLQQQGGRDRSRLEGDIATLESRALAARAQADALADQLVRAEQAAQANADNSGLLEATFEQARATLGVDAADLADQGQALQALYAAASARLGELSRVRRETGRFYLADGTEVEGNLVRIGNIAAYGLSAQGSGALAPAGGGRFRLWNAPSAEAAAALAQGRMPAQLPLFLFENADLAVAEPERKSLTGELRKGGLIGYVIVALGALALLLVVLRVAFLQRASASIGRIIEAVALQLRAHRIDEAIAAAKRFKGSAARVVTAALRNVDRDREHLEDIVSESILHESGHLNRFGGVILMIAAVAPLLGLLGTVTGMIQTFAVITEFGTSDPKLLSGGIAVALVTTQLGLLVAIPCLLAGNLLNGWAERIKDDMEKAALRAINLHQDARLTAAPARAAA